MEKILLYTDTLNQARFVRATHNAINAYNGFVEWTKEIEMDVEIPHETIVMWCNRGISIESATEFAQTQFKDQTKYLRQAAREALIDDLLSYPEPHTLGGTDKLWTKVTFDKGIANVKKGGMEELLEETSIYVEGKEAIKLYERHKVLCEQLNELFAELRPLNERILHEPVDLLAFNRDLSAKPKLLKYS